MDTNFFDWKKIRKEYKRLGVPDGLYNPISAPLESAKYNVIVTERSSGKTTNILLLGMLLHKMYGTVIQYIRQYDIMLAPKNARGLYDVIIEHGYIERLTDGKYNTCLYKSRRWYYARVEDETIIEQSLEPFCVCLSIDNDNIYKSSYNAPKGDYIVYDEFCNKRHMPDEFLLFCDLLSTIIRDRKQPVIWMLGNTIDRYDYYYDELEIADYIKYMAIGDTTTITTSKGTPIYIDIFSPTKTRKQKVNRLFFGFANSKLNAITGDDWLITPCQHIDRTDDREMLDNSHYVKYDNNILQIEICNSDKYGLHCVVHKSTNIDKTDIIIYSCDNMLDIRYRYRYGHSNIDRMIWTLYARNKFFYATNSDAAVMSKYIDLADQSKL